MTRELLIMRHGHAEDEGSEPGARRDWSRELTSHGKRDAQRVGAWMHRSGMVPDHVISSPAERARNTAEKASKAAGLDGDRVCCDEHIYEASSQTLLAVLKTIPAHSQRALLVGHNPGVSALANLVCGGPDRLAMMPPGALVHTRFDGDWCDLEAGDGGSHAVVLPDQLPRQFPFPAPDGEGQRPRPAYYYRQSAVIPYRKRNGVVEILLIRSSKRKRWGIPKGIHDPGKSAQDSAANEAFEEAGILGEVGEERLGAYQHEKWDATCEVTVFPMLVGRVLPEAEWPERHRGRRWVPLEQAEEEVSNKQLGQLISELPANLAGNPASRKI